MEHGVRVEIDVAAAEVLGERSQAALYEIVREAFEGAIRRGPPTLFSVHAAQAAPDSVEVTIHDDAPSERRRRSIEVLEERARTLGAALSVDLRRRRHDHAVAIAHLRSFRLESRAMADGPPDLRLEDERLRAPASATETSRRSAPRFSRTARRCA